ncbi:sensor histidine kinase [Flavobacterium sp. JP2137]|uniref:sensor histidine kinase n=1 Tax=Flavobacterium sp. JP2137 TaxID=3414510 RepID=UPI003D2FBED3
MEYNIKCNPFINLLTENRFRFFRHIAILIILMIFILNARDWQEYSGNYEYYSLALAFVLFVSMFYINMYVLVPRFFFKGYYLLYLSLVFIMVGSGVVGIKFISEIYFEPHRLVDRIHWNQPFREIISATVFFSPFIMASTTLKLFQRWIKDSNRIDDLKNLTLSMELKELKNQINPHFLFNMLNNVSFLVKQNPEKASFTIHKLSEFLRYQLYENNQNHVSLQAELEFLSNFLNLEKIRRDNFSFDIDTAIPDDRKSTVLIPPNLFTTFVENAIKHSVILDEGPTSIHISFSVVGDRLHFNCVNSKSNDIRFQSGSKSNGLGLINIQRRLELLYENDYELIFDNRSATFSVALILPL